MSTNKILLLPGDGIGPEVTTQAVRVLEAVTAKHGISIETSEELIGGASIDAHGTPLRDEVVAAARESAAVLPAPSPPARLACLAQRTVRSQSPASNARFWSSVPAQTPRSSSGNRRANSRRADS